VVVLLLAIAPLARLAPADRRTPAIWLCVALCVVAIGLLGVLKRDWSWYAAAVVPVGLLAGGLLHWALAVLGVLFGLVWLYVLSVRRTVLRSSAR
jgi:hypothetical protein